MTPIQFSFAPHPADLTIYQYDVTAALAQACAVLNSAIVRGSMRRACRRLEAIAKVPSSRGGARARIHFPAVTVW